MSNDTGRPSTPALFADALSQMTALFETELRLVRTEVGEKLSAAVRAVVVIVVAAVFLLAALVLLLVGLVQVLIAYGMVPWQAYLAVGVFIAVVGIIALLVAIRQFSADRLMPKQSFSQLSKDADVVKETVR